MQRRKFLGFSLGLLALSATPVTAKDYRKELPKLWEVKNDEKHSDDLKGVNEAIKTLFGSDKTESGVVKLKAPAIAENGAVVPISFKADKAKRIALFQSADPEATVAVFDVPEKGIPDYSVRIKLQQTGTVVVVAEVDGKLYRAEQVVKVTVGGCGG